MVWATTYAQAPLLQPVYEKIDVLAQTSPDLMPVLVEKLEELSTIYAGDVVKTNLIDAVVRYIRQTYMNEGADSRDISDVADSSTPSVIWSRYSDAAYPIPAGFNQVPLADLKQMAETFHFRGDESAPIWVVEFLDFQCPYCQRQHTNNVMWELRDVEFPGQVRTAAAMFPLTGKWHELATQAAEAAECAYIQWGSEVFYEYKAGLYAAGLKPTMTVIRNTAANVWLDPDRHQACMDEWFAATPVQAQKNYGIRMWVRGTPGTVVIDSRTWAFKALSWARDPEGFMGTIEELLG